MTAPHAYALTSRTETNRVLRKWTAISRTAFYATLFALDVAVIVTMAWLTGVGYHLATYGLSGSLLSYLEVGLMSAAIFVFLNFYRGEYKLRTYFSFKPHLRRTIQSWNATFICLLALGFMTQISAVFSRGWVVLYYMATLGVLLLTRYLAVQATVLGSRLGLISAQRIFLFGTGKHIDEFITRHDPRAFGVNIIGCHFLTPVQSAAPEAARRAALKRDLEAAIASARILEPEAIFLVMPWSATDPIHQCAEELLKLPVEIHLGAEHILDRYEHVQLSKHGSMASLQLTRTPLSRFEQWTKRAFDLLLASIAVILLTPIFAIVALLIKLDSPGPIFFLQHRFGFNQKPFRIIKFRTMHTLDDGPVVNQAKKGDPRITSVGAWLRRTNIDELPQLFNVIMGEMSLVGPRPHALSHDREYERRIALYARRHNVKPGITGWAQIHGLRGETDTDEKMRQRVEHDLYYIDNWWLGLDLQIILRTALSPKAYRNAH